VGVKVDKNLRILGDVYDTGNGIVIEADRGGR